MSEPTYPLDAVKQAHVDAVKAAAGGSDSDAAAALAQLRRLLPHLTALPSSALTFDVDADSEQEDQRVLLGKRTRRAHAEHDHRGSVQLPAERRPAGRRS